MHLVKSEILDQFRRFRRRHLWVRGWDLFLQAAFVMTITAAMMLLGDRVLFELGLTVPLLSAPERLAVILGGMLVLAGGFAVLVLFLRPTPPVEIAWKMDRAAGGEERFLSALEISAGGNGGRFAEAICRDAAQVARRVEPHRVLPRVPVGYRWSILLSLATGTLLYAYPPRLYDAPIADFDAAPARGPAPLDVRFVDGSIGAIDRFLWDFGDGQYGAGEEVEHRFDLPGRYSVRLRLEGPGGVSETVREIEVLDPGQAAADFEAAPAKGRAPLEVRFINLSANAERYEWDFGDGVRSRDEEPVHTYDRPGLYTVRLKAFNQSGVDERVRESAIKVVHPDAPLANFRATPRKGEAPLKVFFEDMSVGGLTEWEWDFGDPHAGKERTSTERNPTHEYKAPGRYTVRLRVKGPHGEDVEEKVRYIRVEDDRAGKGGGGGGGRKDKKKDPSAKKPERKRPGSAGKKPGQLFGKQPEKRTIKTIPEHLRSHKPGTKTVEKEITVVTPGAGGKGDPRERPIREVLPEYRRAAEDVIQRELIPPALRAHVRRYYENLPR